MTVQPVGADAPQSIGRYRVLGLLGSGGMGRVLLGVGPDGRLVAIKQVHAHLLDRHEYRLRFRREVTAGMRVSGAFTAPVIDFDLDCRTPWLASVFVSGIPLNQAVADHGPLPVPAVRTLAGGLAAALADIHRAGLVHRDLKPGNVLLTEDGPRVIDFGIARLVEGSGQLTETGTTIGSPAYMSPEQASSEPVSPASDIFALGTVLTMASTGRSPFAAPSTAYTLFSIVHTEPDLSPVPAELRELIAACLHKSPEQRPTPAQLLHYLGPLPSAASVWPAELRADIGRNTQALIASYGSADTTRMSSSKDFIAAGATSRTDFPARSTGGNPRSRRAHIVRPLLIVLLTMTLLGAGGAVWMRLTESHTPSEAEPTLSTLRNSDACAWLRTAVQESDPPNSGWPEDISSWKWTTSEEWGCQVKAGDQTMGLSPGTSVKWMHATGTAVAGLPVLTYNSTPSCARAVSLSGEQGWGILLSMEKAQTCDFADRVLARVVATRSTPPQRTDTASLAGVDVCGLLSRDLLNNLVGPIAETPSEVSAHLCTWQGAAAVKLQMTLDDPRSYRSGDVVELGDGVQVFRSGQSFYCRVNYLHRAVGDKTEIARIDIDGVAGRPENRCDTAESIAKAMIAELRKLR
ncbi:serine/threonine-protein kinase [Nocardia sp. NPDC051030]|uniref:serine/threonine-protein kinase n=1 Tax=Nocardia sp. NPDC051030 TaxID=3155162 RepID=UPI00343457E0